MTFLNFRDWILEHFKLRIPNSFNNIFFTFEACTPINVFQFDTYQSWTYFYKHVISHKHKNYLVSPSSNLIVNVQQLVRENSYWEQLYYIIGKNFFIHFFEDCKIYFKWGNNTYILLSDSIDVTNSKISYKHLYSSFPSFYTVGFDHQVPIKIYKILYNTNSRNKLKVINKTSITLKSEILNEYVGPEIFRYNLFGKKQMKSLIKLIKNNPTIKQYKFMLNEIVPEQVNYITTYNNFPLWAFL